MSGKKESESAAPPNKVEAGPRSLTRLLALFDALSLTPTGMSLAEISVALESPKSSLLNLLRPLVAEGFLVHSSGTYNLGPGIFRLSASVLSASTVTKVIRPYLSQLVEMTRETAMWGELNRPAGEIVITSVVHSPNPLRLQITIGVRQPLYASTAGKVLLAFAEKSWRDAYLSTADFAPITFKPVTRASIQREITAVRADGVLCVMDNFVSGVGAVVAPVFGADGGCLGAMTIAGPSNRLQDNLAQLAQSVVKIAAQASAAFSTEPVPGTILRPAK